MTIRKAKVVRRFDIYEDLGPNVGGTYIGTTRGNGELPESVQRMDEENARIMAKAFEMRSLLKELVNDYVPFSVAERIQKMLDEMEFGEE